MQHDVIVYNTTDLYVHLEIGWSIYVLGVSSQLKRKKEGKGKGEHTVEEKGGEKQQSAMEKLQPRGEADSNLLALPLTTNVTWGEVLRIPEPLYLYQHS